MKCDRCGSLNVVAKIMVHKEDGKQEELNLCNECFEEFAKEHPEIKQGIGINADKLLSMLMSSINNINSSVDAQNSDSSKKKKIISVSKTELTCDRCKTRLKDLQETRRVGCQNCYEVFREEIDKILLEISGENSETMREVIINDEEKISIMNLELIEAIKIENYELAAKLRDEIKELESKLER